MWTGTCRYIEVEKMIKAEALGVLLSEKIPCKEIRLTVSELIDAIYLAYKGQVDV